MPSITTLFKEFSPFDDFTSDGGRLNLGARLECENASILTEVLIFDLDATRDYINFETT
jgi:hypothetical protein